MLDKQQLVFVSRALWGGGAERVVYDLAHNLDKKRFEVHIVCLFDQQNVPFSFDPSISIHYVQPIIHQLVSQNMDQQDEKSIYSFRKKLYHLAKRIYQASIPLSIRNILKIEERLYSLRVSTTPPIPPTRAPSMMEKSKFHLLTQSIENMLPSIWALQQILANFKESAILVPVMEEATVMVWLAQIYKRRHYVSSLHILESQYMQQLYPDIDHLSVQEWFLSNACRSAMAVTFPSKGCGDDLKLNYQVPGNLIRILPNPVDIKKVQSQSMAQISLEDYRGKIVFVSVGRLDPQKNHSFLLDACEILKKQIDNFVILCLGEGPTRPALQSQIVEKGLENHVLLMGEVSNPYPYMAAARALVLTSKFESFAIVLVEAMACGTVPVSVDCPFGPRDVLDNGKYGLLLPPNDPRSLADAMCQIAQDDDLYNRLRTLGLERAKEYDISNISLQWEQMLIDVKQRAGISMKPIGSEWAQL